MQALVLYRDLGVALAVGLLIGVERSWQLRSKVAGTRVAGFRTFGLLGGLGGLIGLLARYFHPLVPVLLLAGVVITLVVGTLKTMTDPGSVSATMLIASLVTVALGMLATSGQPAIAIAAAAVTTLLLSARDKLHSIIARLGEGDVQALARFAIIAGAILPFLPSGRFGPYDAWNLQQLWMVVVLVTGFSFAGYIANRLMGVRYGILVTAVIGGLYSSTAVISSLSHRLREGGDTQSILWAGIALASAVMFLRVLVLTAVLAGFAFLPSLSVIGPAAIVAVVIGYILMRKSGQQGVEQPVQPGNPIALLPAVGFLLLVALMAVVVRWAEVRFGGAGIATALIISGSFDVDAAIVTLGGLPRATLTPETGALVVGASVFINTVIKAGAVLIFAGWAKGKPAIFALLAAAATMVVMGGIILVNEKGG
ncbi:MAG: DUF4010 domain-containing protein [Sphingorhabdus sp.]